MASEKITTLFPPLTIAVGSLKELMALKRASLEKDMPKDSLNECNEKF
jgi:hypothetical protein